MGQKEEAQKFQKEVNERAIGYWKTVEIAVREFLIILSLGTLVFVCPYITDELFATKTAALFEKLGLFIAAFVTMEFGAGLVLYTAIGKPVLQSVWKFIVQIATNLRN